MAEINHVAAPPPGPATPILASHLLAIEEKQRKRFAARGERIKTGCGEIDDYMLGGGFERGIVVGISAEGGDGRLISLHLLATILLSNLSSPPKQSIQPIKTKASIIDTTGSFPVSLLAEVLKSRIQTSRSTNKRQAASTGNYAVNDGKTDNDATTAKGVDEDVQRCLEMIAISRVFDIEGLWEVLGEVGKGSEDDRSSRAEDDEEGVEIIILDDMPHLTNELFTRTEKSEAHTILTSLSLALHTITKSTNILTLLHNTTTSAKPHAADPSNAKPYQTHPHRQPQNPQPTSLFPSNPLKAALGQIFAPFPDLHLLMSQLPKSRGDAEMLYARDRDGGEPRMRGITSCFVLEVLKDESPNLRPSCEAENIERKFGAREQRWAAVERSVDGLGLVDAFPAKKMVRGLATAER